MEISPAAGKILGMLMAYAVSALGLLLAYYNYRKRIVRAERIFTPTARLVLGAVIVVAGAALILGAAAASGGEGSLWDGVRRNWVGVLVPTLIFAVSFWTTWRLYRHFTR